MDIVQHHMLSSINLPIVSNCADYISLEKPLKNFLPFIYTGNITVLNSETELMLCADRRRSIRSLRRMLAPVGEMALRALTLMRKGWQICEGYRCCDPTGT